MIFLSLLFDIQFCDSSLSHVGWQLLILTTLLLLLFLDYYGSVLTDTYLHVNVLLFSLNECQGSHFLRLAYSNDHKLGWFNRDLSDGTVGKLNVAQFLQSHRLEREEIPCRKTDENMPVVIRTVHHARNAALGFVNARNSLSWVFTIIHH